MLSVHGQIQTSTARNAEWQLQCMHNVSQQMLFSSAKHSLLCSLGSDWCLGENWWEEQRRQPAMNQLLVHQNILWKTSWLCSLCFMSELLWESDPCYVMLLTQSDPLGPSLLVYIPTTVRPACTISHIINTPLYMLARACVLQYIEHSTTLKPLITLWDV